jgi:hypothetical protein
MSTTQQNQPPGRNFDGATAALQNQWSRLRPLAERYSREYALEINQFLAAVAGSACLFLLVFSTFLNWEHWATEMGDALPGVGNARSYSGLEVIEGKLVCLSAAVGIGAFVATVFVKRLLSASLLIAAAVGTCCLLLTLSYNHQINSYNLEVARVSDGVARNFDATFGADGARASEMFIPRETDTWGLGLVLAIAASLLVASTFIFAAFFKPLTLAVLQKDSLHPFARKHGGLLISQAVAILVGLVDLVLRY